MGYNTQEQLRSLISDERGATAIEYALIAALLSIVIISSVIAINGSLTDIYEHIRSYIVPALNGTAPPDAG